MAWSNSTRTWKRSNRSPDRLGNLKVEVEVTLKEMWDLTEEVKQEASPISSGHLDDFELNAPSKLQQKLLTHESGQCKPCAYFYLKQDGCRNADNCDFCHFCSPKAVRDSKRELKREARREKRAQAAGAREARRSEGRPLPGGSLPVVWHPTLLSPSLCESQDQAKEDAEDVFHFSFCAEDKVHSTDGKAMRCLTGHFKALKEKPVIVAMAMEMLCFWNAWERGQEEEAVQGSQGCEVPGVDGMGGSNALIAGLQTLKEKPDIVAAMELEMFCFWKVLETGQELPEEAADSQSAKQLTGSNDVLQ